MVCSCSLAGTAACQNCHNYMQYYGTMGQFQKGEYLITKMPLTDEEIKEIAEKVVQLLSERNGEEMEEDWYKDEYRDRGDDWKGEE